MTNRINLDNNRITLLQGDSAELLKKIKSDCIDLTVTSPPYDDLRKYNGYSFDFETIAKELYRVTKIGGVVVWVVGDQTINGSETCTSFRQALYFREIGFNLHDTMIWAKEKYRPLTHNRYEQQFEYMFIFTNGKPKTFNPIKINSIHAGKIPGGTFQHSSNGIRSERHTYKPVADTKIKPNIWYYNMQAKTDHSAGFPEQLANDHILSWSNDNDVVLDPFMGSGTTGKLAILNNRRFIGIELSEEYFNNIAVSRCQEALNAKQ